MIIQQSKEPQSNHTGCCLFLVCKIVLTNAMQGPRCIKMDTFNEQDNQMVTEADLYFGEITLMVSFLRTR